MNTPSPSQAPQRPFPAAITEKARLWSESEVRFEAARCLYCYNAPCARGCPAGVDVAEFIRSIRSGAYRAAARLVLSANVLGETCGCVCPTKMLCEGECVLPQIDGQAPIAIGRLQRFVIHWARTHDVPLFEAGSPTGKRVALIGAGPASIACAHELARRGHRPVLFERGTCAGGLNRMAIAPHKMGVEVPLAEAEWLLRIGAEMRCGAEVGVDISFGELERDYDAIFIGVGLGLDRQLGVPGEDAQDVIGAIELLDRIKTGRWAPPLPWKRVLCVGGGNSAIDAVRTLREAGVPQVVLIYRRAEEQMKGYASEWQAAKIAGAGAHFLTQPIEVLTEGDRVAGLRCIRMTPGEPDQSGRPRPVPVPDSAHEIAADAIVVAIGQAGARDLLPGVPEEIRFDGARIDVSSETGATSLAGYFAGGDCANGGAEVVNAAAEGLRAARAIDQYLAAEGA